MGQRARRQESEGATTESAGYASLKGNEPLLAEDRVTFSND